MTRRFIIRGVVQGVGFRWFVVRKARGFGLTGFVRNLGDGSVEVVADGPGPALVALEGELQQGPPGAQVTTIGREEWTAAPMASFEVR
jgi:acylphosphatase